MRVSHVLFFALGTLAFTSLCSAEKAADWEVKDNFPKRTRLPIPTNAQQREAEKIVREVFKDELAKTAAADKIALAKMLADKAAETTDDPVGRYVMLILAANQSADAADLNSMFAYFDRIEAEFEGDLAPLKKIDLGIVITRGHDPNRTKLALAYKTLLDKPTDPAAGLIVGKHLCFTNGDFDHGLAFLAKSAHPDLSRLAKLDMSNPVDAPAQLKVGDAWWELSDKTTDKEEKHQYQLRSGFWYYKALPSITGLNKMKLEKRIEISGAKMVATSIPKEEPPPRTPITPHDPVVAIDTPTVKFPPEATPSTRGDLPRGSLPPVKFPVEYGK